MISVVVFLLLCYQTARADSDADYWQPSSRCLAPDGSMWQTISVCTVAILTAERALNLPASSVALNDSQPSADQQDIARLYLARANARFFAGEARSSIDDYQRAIAWLPWSATAQMGLGRSLYVMRQDSDARLALDEAVALFPSYALPYRYFGLISLRAGQTKQAIKHLSVAVKRAPTSAENHVFLGMAQFFNAQPTIAHSTFKQAQALKLSWDYLPLWLYLTSPKSGQDKQTLDAQRSALNDRWPAPILTAALTSSTIKLRASRGDLMSDDSIHADTRQSAALFYAHLISASDGSASEMKADTRHLQSQPPDTTIEQQMLPLLHLINVESLNQH